MCKPYWCHVLFVAAYDAMLDMFAMVVQVRIYFLIMSECLCHVACNFIVVVVTFSRQRGYSLMVKLQPSKLIMRVRFPLLA